MHLPLSPIDTINQPPESYLWIQDGLTLGSGILWGIAYILYIRQSFRDKSYGMPILSLCANIAWELVYGLIHPPAMAEYVTFLPYFLIDLGLVYGTLLYGADEFKHAPLVQKTLPYIILVGSLMMLGAHWSFVELFTDYQQASFWSGYACQIIVSWSAIAQLLSRGNTRGHTMTIWCLRFTGTLCATGVFQWRLYNYPINYTYVDTTLAKFLFTAPEISELAYPFVFWYVQGLERQQKKKVKA